MSTWLSIPCSPNTFRKRSLASPPVSNRRTPNRLSFIGFIHSFSTATRTALSSGVPTFTSVNTTGTAVSYPVRLTSNRSACPLVIPCASNKSYPKDSSAFLSCAMRTYFSSPFVTLLYGSCFVRSTFMLSILRTVTAARMKSPRDTTSLVGVRKTSCTSAAPAPEGTRTDTRETTVSKA